MSSIYSFIEYRSPPWEVYQIKSSTLEALSISNDPDKTITLSPNDPKLKPFRTHTELLKGSETLLNSTNFLDYSLIQSILNKFEENPDSNFFSFASGHLFFSFYQMMTLNYSQYSEYKVTIVFIAEAILKNFIVFLNYNPSFVENNFPENGNIFIRTGWLELGKIVDWIAGNQDISIEFNLNEGIEVMRESRNIFQKYFQQIASKFKILLKGKSCLRFFYAFKAVFHYEEGFVNDWLEALKGIDKSDLKFYEVRKTEEILNELQNKDWRSFVEVNFKVFLESEKLFQKREIIEIVEKYFEYIPFNEIDLNSVLVKCFEHENLAKSARLFISKCAQFKLIHYLILENIAKELQDVVVIEEFVNTFSSLINYFDSQTVFTLLKIMNGFNVQDNQILVNLCKIIMGNGYTSIDIQKSIGQHDIIFKSFSYINYDVELEYLDYYLRSSQESVLDLISSLIRSVDKTVFKRLDYEKNITGILVEIINNPDSFEIKNKAIEIFDLIVHNEIQGTSIIDYLSSSETYENLKHIIFNWAKTEIFDHNITKIFLFITEKISENLNLMTPDAYFHLFCKLNKNNLLLTGSNRIYCFNSSQPLQGLDFLLKYYLINDSEKQHFDYFKNLQRSLMFSLQKVNLSSALDNLFEKTLEFLKNHEKNTEKLADLIFGLMGVFTFDDRKVELEIDIGNTKNFQIFEFPDFYDVEDLRMDISAEFNIRFENIQIAGVDDKMSVKDLVGKKLDLNYTGEGKIHKNIYTPNDNVLLSILQEKHKKYLARFIQQESGNDSTPNTILSKLKSFFNNLKLEDYEDFQEIFKKMVTFPLMHQLNFKFIMKKRSSEKNTMKKYPAELYESFLILAKSKNSELVKSESSLKILIQFKIFSVEHLCHYLDTATEFQGNFLVSKELFFSETINELISDLVTRMSESQNFTYLKRLSDYIEANLLKIIDCEHFKEILKAFNLFSFNSDLNKRLKQKIISCIDEYQEPLFTMRDFSNHLTCLDLIEERESCDQLICYLNKWLFQQDHYEREKFKHPSTLSEAYKLILKYDKFSILTSKIFADFETVIENYNDFKSSHLKSKSLLSINPIGLFNFGSTCYINSILQFLYLNEKLVDQVLASRSNDENLKSLQFIFLKLRFSWISPVRSKYFMKNFKILGRDIHPFEQMDASELLNSIFDTLENNMVNALNSFQVEFEEVVTCRSCQKNDMKILKYSYLPINITAQSLEMCLENYLQDKKTGFEFNCCAKSQKIFEKKFKHVPDYFLISLNRFTFDAVEERVVKVYDQCCIPEEICFIGVNLKLVGVVVHIGNAQEGHYVCLARQDEDWVLFDDSSVKNFNEKDLDFKNWIQCSGNFFNNNKLATPYLILYSRNTKYEKVSHLIDSRLAKILRKNSKKVIFSRFISKEFIVFALGVLRKKKFDDFFMNYLFKFAVFNDESERFEEIKIELQKCLTEKNYQILIFNYFSFNFSEILENFISIKNLEIVQCFYILLNYIQDFPGFFDLFKKICLELKSYNLIFHDFTEILNVLCNIKGKNKNFEEIAEIILSNTSSNLENIGKNILYPLQPTSFKYFFELLENPENEKIFNRFFGKNFNIIQNSIQRNEDFEIFAKLTAKAYRKNILKEQVIFEMTNPRKRLILIQYLKELGQNSQYFNKILEFLMDFLSLDEAIEIKQIIEKIESKSNRDEIFTIFCRNLDKNIQFYESMNLMHTYKELKRSF